MFRKISIMLLSIAILITGVIAFGKLGYWERTVRIFSFSPDVPAPVKWGNGSGEKVEFSGHEGHDLSNNKKEGYVSGDDRLRAGRQNINMPDSARQNIGQHESGRIGGASFRDGMRNGEGRRGGEFRGGKKINLKNVLYFLSVFAAFTVTGLYADRGLSLLRKRRARKQVLLEKL